jgi:hypothetical protein
VLVKRRITCRCLHNQIRCEAPSESEAPITICEGCSKSSTTSVSAQEIRATHGQAPLHRPRLHEIGAFLAKIQGPEILCKLIPPLRRQSLARPLSFQLQATKVGLMRPRSSKKPKRRPLEACAQCMARFGIESCAKAAGPQGAIEEALAETLTSPQRHIEARGPLPCS